MAVRERCGIFDVSHMGQIETSGPGALELLQRLLSNDVARIPISADRGGEVGGAQYSLLCREDGGVLDDLFTYRLGAERYLTVTNAANHARDLDWFSSHAETFGDVELTDRIDGLRDARRAGARRAGNRAGLLGRSAAGANDGRRPAAGRRQVLVCGTGYTGEDGVELLCDPEDAGAAVG